MIGFENALDYFFREYKHIWPSDFIQNNTASSQLVSDRPVDITSKAGFETIPSDSQDSSFLHENDRSMGLFKSSISSRPSSTIFDGLNEDNQTRSNHLSQTRSSIAIHRLDHRYVGITDNQYLPLVDNIEIMQYIELKCLLRA